jgi:ELWxxDGT repeat protein
VKDIAPGTLGSKQIGDDPPLVQYAGRMYFAANDGTHNDELWVTDGTKTGTRLVSDMRPGPRASRPVPLGLSGHGLLLAAEDANHGYELWTTNGTASGTTFVRDIRPGVASSYPGRGGGIVVQLGSQLLFAADDRTHGEELWRSNGTASGTSLLKDIWPGDDSSGLFYLTRVRTKAFFTADDGTHGSELWVTDGTSSGTTLVTDLNP